MALTYYHRVPEFQVLERCELSDGWRDCTWRMCGQVRAGARVETWRRARARVWSEKKP